VAGADGARPRRPRGEEGAGVGLGAEKGAVPEAGRRAVIGAEERLREEKVGAAERFREKGAGSSEETERGRGHVAK